MSNVASASHIEKLLLCLVLFFGFADGRFTAPICAPDNNCIQKNSQGTWCYIPAPSTSGGTPDCVGPSFKTPDMTPFIAVHIKQGLSIAYYNEVDTTILGDANYSIPAALGRVVLCASGAWAGSFQTQCLPTQQDNNMWPQFNSECIVSIAQDFVSDGCYVPKSAIILTGDPSTSTPGSRSAPLSSPTQSVHVITPTLTTFIQPTISTIVTNGVTQTIVVAPFNASSSGPNQSKSVVLPIVLPLFFVILVALGVFVWWYKKRARERRYFAGPRPFDRDEPPPWGPGDGK